MIATGNARRVLDLCPPAPACAPWCTEHETASSAWDETDMAGTMPDGAYKHCGARVGLVEIRERESILVEVCRCSETLYRDSSGWWPPTAGTPYVSLHPTGEFSRLDREQLAELQRLLAVADEMLVAAQADETA